MISLTTLVVVMLLAGLAFCAGGVLVGAARRGENEYLRQRVTILEAEVALRPRAVDMDTLHVAHATAVAQVIAMADGAAHARLNPRKAADEPPDPAFGGRTYSPTELRERGDDVVIEFGDAPPERQQTEEEIKAEFETAQSTAPPPEG